MFGGIAAMIGAWLTEEAVGFVKKLGKILMVITIIGTVTAVILAAAVSAINAVSVSVPSYVRDGLDMVLPSNFLTCTSTLLGLRVTGWLWKWKVHFLELYAGNGN